jgi:hypothetical protein
LCFGENIQARQWRFKTKVTTCEPSWKVETPLWSRQDFNALDLIERVNIPGPSLHFVWVRDNAGELSRQDSVSNCEHPAFERRKSMETETIQTAEFERIQSIDPREAKLDEIIEKGRTSLRKTLEEIQHVQEKGRSCRECLARTSQY